jgi:Mrp family chromosome partitioning ATPase/capsular polysaccharide biosynthesis protein
VAASYLAALRARWLVVVGVAAVCVAVAVAFLMRSEKSYTARADILVTPISAADEDFVGIHVLRDSTIAPSANVLTVARLVKTPATAAIVEQQPAFASTGTTGLLNAISVSPLSQTSIVAVGASASSPERAAALANAFASATMTRRTQVFQASLRPAVDRLRKQATALGTKAGGAAERTALEARLAVLQPLVGAADPSLSLLNPADPPTATSGPGRTLVLAAAAVGGLLIGLLCALALELVDRRVRRDEEIGFADAPVRVRVPSDPAYSPLAAATGFRDLRARLLPRGCRSIALVGAGDGAGTTTAAVHLARGLAATGQRVALLDCDFRRPTLARRFDVEPPQNGFDRLFSATGSPLRALVRVPGVPGKLLLGLPTIRTSFQLARLDGDVVRTAFAGLGEKVDAVVVDSPPASRGSEALLLAEAADATVVTVRLGHTRRGELERLERSLSELGVGVDAIVVFAAGGRRRIRRLVVRLVRAIRSIGSVNGPAEPLPARRPAREPARRPEERAPVPQVAEATAARQQ